MLRQRQPRERNNAYLAYIRTQPCAICGDTYRIEAAHLRLGSISHDKRPTGMGEKSSDRWAVPLCKAHHCRQHMMNEAEFWASYGVLDPIALSMRYHLK